MALRSGAGDGSGARHWGNSAAAAEEVCEGKAPAARLSSVSLRGDAAVNVRRPVGGEQRREEG